MKNAYRRATGGLVALGVGVTVGCGGGAATPTAPEPPVEKVEQSIQQSFDRLNALHVVSAARLVLDLPAEATACYGLPCDPASEQRYNAERARQAPRLEQLVSFAEVAARGAYVAMRDKSESEAAIRALNGLAVVEVTALVEVS